MSNGNIEILVAQYRNAEDCLKGIETILSDEDEELSSGLLIPAVNELRYAGHHMINLLANEGEENIQKAINHCERALYDITDASILFILAKLDRIMDMYLSMEILSTIPTFKEDRKTIERIRQSRLHPDTTRKSWEELQTELKALYRINEGWAVYLTDNHETIRDKLNRSSLLRMLLIILGAAVTVELLRLIIGRLFH